MSKSFENALIAFVIGLCFGIGATSVAETHKTAEVNKVANIQSTEATQGVSYDYVYVNGTRYIVFQSSSGDIEVVR